MAGAGGTASLKLRAHFGVWSRAGRKVPSCLTLAPVSGGVAGQGVGEGSRLPSFFSCSSGMQALVLLLWTGALLGYGSSQNVASGSEVSRVGRCGQQLF